MKSKRILKFYFNADSLERVIDNAILKTACASADPTESCEFYAERILKLTAAKDALGGLWGYLDGCLSQMGEGEREVLRRYAAMRVGIERLDGDERREIRRCLIKFSRRARSCNKYTEGLRLVDEYYCLL